MKKELPHFLHFLLNRKLSTPWESRMWFRHDLLVTPALCQIINYNRSKAEAEMLQIINEIMANEKLTELSFCIGDMVAMLDIRGIKTEHAHIRKILQHNWELKPKEPTHYTSYCLTFDGDVKSSPKIGRCYTVDNSRNDLFLLLC